MSLPRKCIFRINGLYKLTAVVYCESCGRPFWFAEMGVITPTCILKLIQITVAMD